jgi:hypothetical protein
MYRHDTELLFPMRVTPALRDLRGDDWRALVDSVCHEDEASLYHLAFSLMLIRLNRCLTCHPDSYRAMHGCTVCACQSVRRFRGQDSELVAMFNMALDEIQGFILTNDIH